METVSCPNHEEMRMSNEAIRKLLEERARLIADKNAEGALRFYADDVVNFDLAPPLAYRGTEATDPRELQRWSRPGMGR
jgi:ketosteroid isomerase-like protein